MMVNCPICGKLTCIYWPEFWVYKRGETYYCSAMCMDIGIVRDTKLMNEVKAKRKRESMATKITLAQKKQAVQIAIDGGDPLAYLENLGSKRPDGLWYTIKEDLKKVDPETYAKIPDYRGKTRKPAENPATVKLDGALRIETPEADMIEIVETPENTKRNIMRRGDFEISAIRDAELGEFYYDLKYNSIDWRAPDGTEVSIPPRHWKQLHEKLPQILHILGVPDDE